MAELFEQVEEISYGLKTEAAFAESGAGDDFGLQAIGFTAKEQALTHADFAAGTDQAFPFVGVTGKLRGQQDLNAAAEKVA